MNYEKHYKKLVTRAPKIQWNGVKKSQAPSWRKRDGVYREAHRIIPKCMGGQYTSENVAYLTPEEHYIAHLLLVKIYPDNAKLLYSANMMTVDAHGDRNNNKKHGWLKRQMSEMMSRTRKGKHSSLKSEWKKGRKPWNLGLKTGISWNRGKKGWMSTEGRKRIGKATTERNIAATGSKRKPGSGANISAGRKGKGIGKRNAMANPEHVEKVRADKIGRKRVYQPDGTFKMVRPLS